MPRRRLQTSWWAGGYEHSTAVPLPHPKPVGARREWLVWRSAWARLIRLAGRSEEQPESRAHGEPALWLWERA